MAKLGQCRRGRLGRRASALLAEALDRLERESKLVRRDDGTVRLWDTETGRPLGRLLVGRYNPVYGVAFSRDGRTLASADYDGTVGLWENLLWRNVGELQAEVCDLVGGGLSRGEGDQYAAGISYRSSCP